MTILSVKAFNGLKPIVKPRLLGDSDAQVAQNARLISGSLEPIRGTTTLKATSLPTPKTIFRYGTGATETNYWLEFANDTDVMRSPIPNDSYDRVYWTDGINPPRYATSSMILSSQPYPGAYYQLGLPAPSAPSVVATGVATSSQTFTISGTQVSAITAPAKVKVTVTTTSGSTDTILNIATVTAANVATSLSSVSGLAAVVTNGDVVVTPATTVTGVVLALKDGTQDNYDPAVVTYSAYLQPGYAAYTFALNAIAISGLGSSNNLAVSITKNGSTLTQSLSISSVSASTVASALSGVAGITASVSGSDVSVTLSRDVSALTITNQDGGTVYGVSAGSGNLAGFAQLDNTTDPANPVIRGLASGFFSSNPSPATVMFDPATISAMTVGMHIGVVVNGAAQVGSTVQAGAGTYPSAVTPQSLVSAFAGISGVKAEVVNGTYTVNGSSVTGTFVMVSTVTTGTSATLLIRKITPATQDTYSSSRSWVRNNTADAVKETRVYVVNYVSAYGEEGPPSAASTAVQLSYGQSATVSLPTAPAGNYNITLKRIYRSSTVGNQAQFQFVADVPVALGNFVDTVAQADLGEVMPSETWVAPPADLKGLRMMANGAAVGFSGRTVYFSEPNMPHAWPHKYTIDFDIVGIATYGQTVAVLTTAFPFLLQGADPAAMTPTKLEVPQACVSKRGIIETGSGVLYPSPDGYVSLGAGIDVITRNLLSRDQWQAYVPSSMDAYLYDGRIHLLYNTGTARGMLIVDGTGQGAILTTCTYNQYTPMTAGYYDATTDTLYLAQNGSIMRFDRGNPTMATWRSKVFRLPWQQNMSVGQVIAASYPVVLRVYADGVKKVEQTITSNDIFTLPGGFRARDWEFEIDTAYEVSEVNIATSAAEIKAV